MTSVFITEAAWSDLIDIFRHVSAESPPAADRLLDEFHDRCRSLAGTPLAFPLVAGYEHANIRRRVHGNYLIFYRSDGDLIEVIHVLHGARDYDEILEG